MCTFTHAIENSSLIKTRRLISLPLSDEKVHGMKNDEIFYPAKTFYPKKGRKKNSFFEQVL